MSDTSLGIRLLIIQLLWYFCITDLVTFLPRCIYVDNLFIVVFYVLGIQVLFFSYSTDWYRYLLNSILCVDYCFPCPTITIHLLLKYHLNFQSWKHNTFSLMIIPTKPQIYHDGFCIMVCTRVSIGFNTMFYFIYLYKKNCNIITHRKTSSFFKTMEISLFTRDMRLTNF